MFIHLKTNMIFPILETRRDGSDGGSVQRGRKKAAELHRSSAKRVYIWPRGVKRSELAIGLAVASGGEAWTREEEKRSGGPVVDLQLYVETMRFWSKTCSYHHNIDECILYYDQSDPQVAQRMRCLLYTSPSPRD